MTGGLARLIEASAGARLALDSLLADTRALRYPF